MKEWTPKAKGVPLAATTYMCIMDGTMLQKMIISIFVVAFGSVALFGVAVFTHDGGPGMGHCPFVNNSSSVCPMTALTHLAAWQALLTMDPVSGFVVLSIVLAFAVLAPWGRELLRAFLYPHQFWVPQRTILLVPDFLTIVFARGILHPKLYA